MTTINFNNWHKTLEAAKEKRDSRTSSSSKRNGKRNGKGNVSSPDGLPTDSQVSASLPKNR